jgi:hypothetical protein
MGCRKSLKLLPTDAFLRPSLAHAGGLPIDRPLRQRPDSFTREPRPGQILRYREL